MAVANGAGIDSSEPVSSEELLYRRILPQHIDWEVDPPHVASEAFFDRDKQISVDRAEIRGYDPTPTQEKPENCVCCLLTHKVRKIDDVVTGGDRSGKTWHAIDVVSYPLSYNQSHAHIVGNPHVSGKKAFRRLRHSLRRLSTWKEGIAPDY